MPTEPKLRKISVTVRALRELEEAWKGAESVIPQEIRYSSYIARLQQAVRLVTMEIETEL
jgi:hypothetical protein